MLESNELLGGERLAPHKPSKAIPITLAKGDGIGPEIMEATLKILKASEANLLVNEIEIGEKVYLSGNTAGIAPEAWESLRQTKVFLKAPITTPQGGGYKSLNVTIRKTLGLYANVRPCISYSPFVATKHPQTDIVIVRENEEDLYGGIEHQQTDEVVQCLKLISKPGSEKIIRYAFEYARVHGRKKVTCFTKDNIMKLTDGLFHKLFEKVAQDYPDIQSEHWIIDIGAAKIATSPEQFDVVVMPNLYGDIVSDITAQITGSVGLAGSANIGENNYAMFEAIHGSAPDIAGKNIANPSGLILAAVQMLLYVKENAVAEKIHNAWLRTLEDGIHTADIFKEDFSTKRVGTQEFADALIERLGEEPQKFKPVNYSENTKSIEVKIEETPQAHKENVGVDIFLQWRNQKGEKNAQELGESLSKCTMNGLELVMITNRGVKVYPNGLEETFCTDHWRCRFQRKDESALSYEEILELMHVVSRAGFDIIKTENLCTFDGKRGFSLGQGQ